jgi:hypothetical protein
MSGNLMRKIDTGRGLLQDQAFASLQRTLVSAPQLCLSENEMRYDVVSSPSQDTFMTLGRLIYSSKEAVCRGETEFGTPCDFWPFWPDCPTLKTSSRSLRKCSSTVCLSP